MIVSLLMILLGVLFIFNGWTKLANLGTFRDNLVAYDPRLSSPNLAMAFWILAEFVAGVSLLTPTPWRCVPVTWLLSAATGAVLHRFSQGARHDCGCTSLVRREINASTVVTNFVLVAMGLSACVLTGGPEIAAVAGSGSLLCLLIGYGIVGRPPVPERA